MTKQEILDYFKDINEAYNDCTRLDSLAMMLNEVTASREWIPVSERLPKTGKAVLVCCDGKLHDAMVVADIDALGLWHPITGDHIAYWMPLPEPPKEGEVE